MSQESYINQGKEPKGQKAAGLQSDSSCISKYSWSLTTLNYTANYYSLLLIFLMSVTGLAHPFAGEAHAVSNERKGNCPLKYVAMVDEYQRSTPKGVERHLIAAGCYGNPIEHPPVYMTVEEIEVLTEVVKQLTVETQYKSQADSEFSGGYYELFSSTAPVIQ